VVFSSISVRAARWRTTSGEKDLNADSSAGESRMSVACQLGWWEASWGAWVERLRSWCPRARRRLTTCVPMKPEPPVIRIVIIVEQNEELKVVDNAAPKN